VARKNAYDILMCALSWTQSCVSVNNWIMVGMRVLAVGRVLIDNSTNDNIAAPF
jgi:hypothetical protein